MFMADQAADSSCLPLLNETPAALQSKATSPALACCGAGSLVLSRVFTGLQFSFSHADVGGTSRKIIVIWTCVTRNQEGRSSSVKLRLVKAACSCFSPA